MNETIECPCCHTKLDCEIETEVIGLREHQDVEVQSRITPVILDEATEVPDVGFELLAERTPLIKPIIVLASDDSDLRDDVQKQEPLVNCDECVAEKGSGACIVCFVENYVQTGRQQAQDEASEGRWKGER